jgi:hypothetical protein
MQSRLVAVFIKRCNTTAMESSSCLLAYSVALPLTRLFLVSAPPPLFLDCRTLPR